MCGMTLIHFQRIVLSKIDVWELAKVDFDYFAQALSDPDGCPDPTTLDCQDVIASQHTNGLLTNARYVKARLNDLTSLRDPMSVSTGARSSGAQCAKCYQAGLHAVGHSNCYFCELPREMAKLAARDVVEKTLVPAHSP
jgi:hypothetical protein